MSDIKQFLHTARGGPVACAVAVALASVPTARAQSNDGEEPPTEPVTTATQGAEVIEIFDIAPAVDGDTGSKLSVPLESLPATVTIVDAGELRERGVDDLDSALEWVAGVNPVFRYGGFQYMTVRGFSDFLVLNDGVRDDRHTFVSSAPQSNLVDTDRIEVLKGPGSVLYGYGAIGGAVNLLRKQPQAVPGYEFGVALGVPETRRSTLGVTGPVWQKDLRYRIDLGQSFSRDFRGTGTERNAGTLTLQWLPTSRHRLTLRASVHRDRYDTDAGIPTVHGTIPAGVSLDTRYNTPQDRMLYSNTDASLDYRLRITGELELRERLFVARNDYDYFSTEFLQVSESSDRVERGFFFFDRHWRPVINQLELYAETSAVVPAKWLAGYEFAGMWGHSDRSAAIAGADVADIDLLDPAADPQPEVDIPRDGRDVPRQNVHAVYAHHHASLPADLEFVVGARVDMWRRTQRRDTLDPDTGVVVERGDKTERESTALTYRAGLVYRPTGQLASYASYSTSFRPSTALPEDGRQLDPEVGRQLELGQRVRLGTWLHLDVAVYDIVKQDVVIARGMGVFDQAGKQSSRGVELDITAQWSDRLWLTAGYAYTRARFDEFEREDMDLAGYRPRFVPDHTANAWLRVRATNALTAGLGARYVGRSYADDENTIPLPAYSVADASLSYRRSKTRTIVTVSNLFNNRDYFVSGIYQQLYPGPPLSALLQIIVAH